VRRSPHLGVVVPVVASWRDDCPTVSQRRLLSLLVLRLCLVSCVLCLVSVSCVVFCVPCVVCLYDQLVEANARHLQDRESAVHQQEREFMEMVGWLLPASCNPAPYLPVPASAA